MIPIMKKTILLLTFVISSFSFADETNPTQEEYAQALLSAVGDRGPRLNQMIRAFASYCGTPEHFGSGMGGNCDDIYYQALQGNTAVILKVLKVLRPREIVQSTRKSTEVMASQQANISARMAHIRSGGNNLTKTNQQNNSSTGILSYNSDGSGGGDFVSPWGFFVNGKFSSGDYNYVDTPDEGFDFDTDGLTMGIDYRLNDKSALGLAVGYAKFESSTFEDSTVKTKAVTFSAYGTFNITDNFYADVKASYSEPEINQDRVLNFIVGPNQNVAVAQGETQSYQHSVVVSSGYQFNSKNGWQITPSLSFEYSQSSMNEFVENGASVWNVAYSEQTYRTLRSVASLQVNKALSLSRGVLIPSFGVSFIHENQNNDNNMYMRVDGMPIDEFFETDMNFVDSDYNLANIALTFVGSQNKQAFIQYSKVFNWNEIDQYNINLGARFEF